MLGLGVFRVGRQGLRYTRSVVAVGAGWYYRWAPREGLLRRAAAEAAELGRMALPLAQPSPSGCYGLGRSDGSATVYTNR